jgi:hypothetical protein
MQIRKFVIYLIVALFIVSCDKEKPLYDETLQVSFKMDGKEYSTSFDRDRVNTFVSTSYDLGQGSRVGTRGVNYQFGDSLDLSIFSGLQYHKANDDQGNYDRLKQLLHTGSKEYRCLFCDTSKTDGAEISFSEGKINPRSWRTQLEDVYNNPATTDQTGSSFVITEVKETQIKGYPGTAFIVKGTFNCNIFEISSRMKRVLTDGKFTCLLFP